jgi:hypothetical protein
MAQGAGTKRPLSFYVSLFILADGLLIALLVFLGEIDLQAGPLRLKAGDLRGPALLLPALFALQWVLQGKAKEGERWQDSFFGPSGSPAERWRAVEVLTLLSAVYVLFVGGAALAQYRSGGPETLSLAMAAQAAWNTVHGSFLSSSLAGDGGYLGTRFSPVMALVAQGYRFWETPEYLVRVQSIALALGAWPVYLIARRDLECRRWAVSLAALYIALPAVRGLNLSGFHPLTLAVTPLFFAFHLLRDRPGWAGYFCVALALACGEGAWLAVALLGLYICLPRRRWREGLFLFLVAFYGYVFIGSFVIPRLGGVGGVAAKEAFGALAGGSSSALVNDPAVGAAVRDLFVPLACVPLFGPLVLAFGLPVLVVALFGGAEGPIQTAVFLPFLFTAAAAGLRRLKGGRVLGRLKLLNGPLLRWALVVLPLLCFGVSPAVNFQDRAPPGYRESLAAAVSRIPADASLATQEGLAARLAHRRELFVFPKTEGADLILLDLAAADPLTPVPGRKEGYEVAFRDEHFLLLLRAQE